MQLTLQTWRPGLANTTISGTSSRIEQMYSPPIWRGCWRRGRLLDTESPSEARSTRNTFSYNGAWEYSSQLLGSVHKSVPRWPGPKLFHPVARGTSEQTGTSWLLGCEGELPRRSIECSRRKSPDLDSLYEFHCKLFYKMNARMPTLFRSAHQLEDHKGNTICWSRPTPERLGNKQDAIFLNILFS